MRTRRNNFSLVGRLPAEILSRIFSFHANNLSNAKNLNMRWITVTRVCRRWRQVALSDPNLWRTIAPNLGVEWVEEMLARSKAALIYYNRELSSLPRVSTRRYLDDEVILRKHLSRVQQLVLFGDVESLTPVMRALTTPAPHLELLDLFRDERRSRGLCVILPSDLFAHDAPKLRHITLHGCAVPWDSPLFRDLTHLDIRVPPSTKSDLSIPTLERLLCILDAMPSLQVLTLDNCLPHPKSISRLVPLRHIGKFSLNGSLPKVVAVLERVSLPSSALLSLCCPEDLAEVNSPDILLDTLVSLLAFHFQTPISPLSRMFISEPNYNGSSLKIQVWDMDITSTPARLQLHLTFAFGSALRPLAESLPLQVCKVLPLQDLQTLEIVYSRALWSIADWMDVSINCPKVAYLRVCRSWTFTLIPMLMERNAFPSLVMLRLRDINFFDSLPTERKDLLSDALLMTLRARSDAGIPVRHLHLWSCMLPRSWLESFKQFANNVVLDPNDLVESDYSD